MSGTQHTLLVESQEVKDPGLEIREKLLKLAEEGHGETSQDVLLLCIGAQFWKEITVYG